jgi:hypothetical protein
MFYDAVQLTSRADLGLVMRGAFFVPSRPPWHFAGAFCFRITAGLRFAAGRCGGGGLVLADRPSLSLSSNNSNCVVRDPVHGGEADFDVSD